MRKISDRIVGGVFATAAMAAVIGGGVWLASAAPATTETPVPASAAPFVGADENGLAAEQEQAAAEAEAARLAAEAAAEAARVAAEQAAAVEVERLAAEQAAENEAPAENFDDPAPEPEPEPEYTGPAPGTQVHTICQVLEDGTQVPCQH